MADYPSIKVDDIFKSINSSNLSKYMNIPSVEEMSYEELNAWYQARLRNHKAISIFFNLLLFVVSASLFHFIWFMFNNHPYQNFLMRNRLFATADLILEAVAEKLKKAEAEYNETLLDAVAESSVGSDTQTDKTEETASEEPALKAPSIENTEVNDKRLEVRIIDTEDPKTVSLAVLHGDIATQWIRLLDDYTLIRSFIRPELTVKLRERALHELFSRSSKAATSYLTHYLSFYISRDLLKQQPIPSNKFAHFSERHENNMDIFALTQTARVKLGDENAEHILYLLNSVLKPSDKIRFFCLASLNPNGLDIPFLNSHFYTPLWISKNEELLYSLGGDLSKIAPCFHKPIILNFFQYSRFERLSLNQWDEETQRLLTSRINELCNSYDKQVYYKSFLRGLDVDQLQTAVLHDFIRHLLISISIRSTTTYHRYIHVLCQVLQHTQDSTAIQMIAETLCALLKSLGKRKRSEKEHWAIPLIHALCCVKYHKLDDDFKERFIELLHEFYKDTPSHKLALYILSTFKIDDITTSEEDTYVLRCVQQKSDHASVVLLGSSIFDDLSENNQLRLIFKYLSLRLKKHKLSDKRQNQVVAIIDKLISQHFAFDAKGEFELGFRVIVNFDLYLLDPALRQRFIDIFKKSLITIDAYTLRILELGFNHIKSFIELSEDEQTALLDYLYALSTEADYLDAVINGLTLINLRSFDKEQLNTFCAWFLALIDNINDINKLSQSIFPLLRKLFLRLNTDQKTLFFDAIREYIDKHYALHSQGIFKFLASWPFSNTSLQDYIVSKIIEMINSPSPKFNPESIAQAYYKLPTLVQHSLNRLLFEVLKKPTNTHLIYHLLGLLQTHSLLSTEECDTLNSCYTSAKGGKNKTNFKVLPLFWNTRLSAEQKSLLCTEPTVVPSAVKVELSSSEEYSDSYEVSESSISSI